MSTESSNHSEKQRVTFRPSEEVSRMLINVEPGARTDFLNKSLTSLKVTEAALRAARLKIAELEREIARQKNCPKCLSQGTFIGRFVGVKDGLVQEQNVVAYCTCGAGQHQIELVIDRNQRLLDAGGRVVDHMPEVIGLPLK